MASANHSWLPEQVPSENDQLLPDDDSVNYRQPETRWSRSRRYQQQASTSSIPADYGTVLSNKNMEEVRDSTFPMDNPTTVALHRCQTFVLKPYSRLLKLVGWEPLMEVDDNRLFRVINHVYLVLIVLLIVAGYIIQFAACFRRDRVSLPHEERPIIPSHVINGTNTTSTPEIPGMPQCQKAIVSQYMIPDFLHSAAYIYMFYLLRIAGSEQLPTLMERVFLQTSMTETGFLSQGKLIRNLRALLWSGVIWVVLSAVCQIFHIALDYTNIDFYWMEPDSVVFRIIMLMLMFLGLVVLDVVYTAVVINFCVQCSLLVYFIKGLASKVLSKAITLETTMEEIVKIQGHLLQLNYNTAIAVSIVLFNFGTYSVLGILAFVRVDNNYTVGMYILTAIMSCMWLAMFFAPIVQAARLTGVCNYLKKIGHELRARPFGYQDTSREELDSFLLYVSQLNMHAKVLFMPVKTSYIVGMVVLVLFVLLLLFQTHVIHVWL